MRLRSERGFSLLELLVAVAIIGIIAAIATMAFLSGVNRAKQKRTLNDMRQVAAAWEARASDTQTYIIAGAGYTFPENDVTYDSLRAALVPTYTNQLPQADGWKHPFVFGQGDGPKEYALRSSGSDGAFENTEVTPGATYESDCDIIYANGSFVTYPEAVKPPAQAQQPGSGQ